MPDLLQPERNRIQSIDIVRGLVMVLMALDHVRDYFHIAAHTDDPMNLATTTPFLFFTRWITHFCAPVFIFLSGTSIYLQGIRKTKKQLSFFLLTRGLWLIFAEVAIVSLAWSFDLHYSFLFLQVIWAIGISMFILGLLIWLPYPVIFGTGILITFGHNLLDYPEQHIQGKSFWWDLAHNGNFNMHPFAPGHAVLLIYPFLPWLGIMLLGYGAGKLYTSSVDPARRKKILIVSGLSLIAFFLLLRGINLYGDPHHWYPQQQGGYTILSFLDTTKYPPSLLYTCMTIGPALLLLAFIEKKRNAFTGFLNVFGRVPFFYYIVHLYLIHLLSTITFFLRGHSAAEGKKFIFHFVIPGEGYPLWIVYAVWIIVILLLYRLCKAYDRYKSTHRSWWLSYI
jgi:uncharacterized membrane protein